MEHKPDIVVHSSVAVSDGTAQVAIGNDTGDDIHRVSVVNM